MEFKEIYADIFIPLIQTLITVSLGGIIAAIISFIMNRSHGEMMFIRSKIENLYLALDEYGRKFISISIAHRNISIGEIDWNQSNDIINEIISKENKFGGFETIQILILIYFPQFKYNLEELEKARTKYFSAVRRLNENYDKGYIRPDTKRLMIKVSDDIYNIIEEMKDEIIFLAKSKYRINKNLAIYSKNEK